MGGYPPTGNGKSRGCWEAFPMALVMMPYAIFMLVKDRRSGNKNCKDC